MRVNIAGVRVRPSYGQGSDVGWSPDCARTLTLPRDILGGIASVPMLSSTIGLTAALGFIAPSLTIVRGVPQVFRIWRTDADGVSAGTWLLTVAVAELWLAWGFEFRVPAEIAANAPNLLTAAAIVCLAAHRRRTLRPSLVSIASISGGGVAVSCIALATGMGWVLSVPAMAGSFCLFLPQLVRVFREHNLAGISLFTWTIAFLAATSWAAYGLLIHQPPIWIPSTVMVPCSLVIAMRVSRVRASIGERPV